MSINVPETQTFSTITLLERAERAEFERGVAFAARDVAVERAEAAERERNAANERSAAWEVMLREKGWTKQLAEAHDRRIAAEAALKEMRAVLGRIQRRAAPGHRTMDEMMRDLLWIDDEARRTLEWREEKP